MYIDKDINKDGAIAANGSETFLLEGMGFVNKYLDKSTGSVIPASQVQTSAAGSVLGYSALSFDPKGYGTTSPGANPLWKHSTPSWIGATERSSALNKLSQNGWR